VAQQQQELHPQQQQQHEQQQQHKQPLEQPDRAEALPPSFAAAPPERGCGAVVAEWLALALVAAAVVHDAALLALPLGLLVGWSPDPSNGGAGALLKAPWPFPTAGGTCAHDRVSGGRALVENVIAAAPVRLLTFACLDLTPAPGPLSPPVPLLCGVRVRAPRGSRPGGVANCGAWRRRDDAQPRRRATRSGCATV
jgi:hypothetical protein